MKKCAVTMFVVLLLCTVAAGVHAQTRTTPVTIFEVPTVKFDPTGNTVQAQQSGVWSVGISPTDNTVKTQAASAIYQCWTTDQVLASGESISWYSPDLSGFTEARVMLLSNSAHPDLKATTSFVGPSSTVSIGACTFYPGTVGLITQANFAPINYQSVYTVPLMSNRMWITVKNNTTASVTIRKDSWVYVVN